MTRPPPSTFCPVCHQVFRSIWAYKAHQDACITAARRHRLSLPVDIGEPGDPPTADEQAYLDELDADRDPDAERAENAGMFRAEVAVPLRGNREVSA